MRSLILLLLLTSCVIEKEDGSEVDASSKIPNNSFYTLNLPSEASDYSGQYNVKVLGHKKLRIECRDQSTAYCDFLFIDIELEHDPVLTTNGIAAQAKTKHTYCSGSDCTMNYDDSGNSFEFDADNLEFKICVRRQYSDALKTCSYLGGI